MARILVDSNIYLQFYAHERTEALLPALVEVKSELLVTTQIVDEVCRNRLNVLAKHMDDCVGKTILGEAAVVHLIPDDQARETIGKSIEEMVKKGEQIQATMRAHLTEAIKLTAQGKDRITKSLETVFSSAVIPTPDQVGRARARWERGNPPGKREDLVGDQINWEVFLDSLGGAEKVWIVSKDGDFIAKKRGEHCLDPLLYRELMQRGVTDVSCFTELSTALKSFKPHANSTTPMNNLPDDTALSEISKVEQQVSQAFPMGLTAPTGVAPPYHTPFLPAISTSGSDSLLAPSGIPPYASGVYTIPIQPSPYR